MSGVALFFTLFQDDGTHNKEIQEGIELRELPTVDRHLPLNPVRAGSQSITLTSSCTSSTPI